MKTEELIQKYPKIFEPYEGNPGNVNWYGVPDGWLPIIDKLCGCIQSYIDNTCSYEVNPDYDAEKYIVSDLSTHKHIKVYPEQVRFLQIKEKYASLRVYTFGHNQVVEGMINFAEHLCDNTCQDCGSEENVTMQGGHWMVLLCEKCKNENKK